MSVQYVTSATQFEGLRDGSLNSDHIEDKHAGQSRKAWSRVHGKKDFAAPLALSHLDHYLSKLGRGGGEFTSKDRARPPPLPHVVGTTNLGGSTPWDAWEISDEKTGIGKAKQTKGRMRLMMLQQCTAAAEGQTRDWNRPEPKDATNWLWAAPTPGMIGFRLSRGDSGCRMCVPKMITKKLVVQVSIVIRCGGLWMGEAQGNHFFLVLTKMSWRSPLTSQYSR